MAPPRRILCSWIGHADLQAMAQELDDGASQRIYDAIGKQKPTIHGFSYLTRPTTRPSSGRLRQ
jgi:hypothetical protein